MRAAKRAVCCRNPHLASEVCERLVCFVGRALIEVFCPAEASLLIYNVTGQIYWLLPTACCRSYNNRDKMVKSPIGKEPGGGKTSVHLPSVAM